MSMTGLQMATAYVGSCLMPPLFGLLAQYVTPTLYPWFLAVILALMFVMAESLHRRTAHRAASKHKRGGKAHGRYAVLYPATAKRSECGEQDTAARPTSP